MPTPQNSKSAADIDLARRIKAITNVFEVGQLEPDYAYVEDLGDGRGYTVTQYGFCTYNDEVAQVINRHAQNVPDTQLKRFLPHLPPVVETTSKAALAGFPAAWRKEILASRLLGVACDEEADVLLPPRPGGSRNSWRSLSLAPPINVANADVNVIVV